MLGDSGALVGVDLVEICLRSINIEHVIALNVMENLFHIALLWTT